MSISSLYWLPEHPDFDVAVNALKAGSDRRKIIAGVRQLSEYRLDFLQTNKLDRHLQGLRQDSDGRDADLPDLQPLTGRGRGWSVFPSQGRGVVVERYHLPAGPGFGS